MITADEDITVDGNIRDNKKLLAAWIFSNFVGHLDKPEVSTTLRDIGKDQMPDTLWIVTCYACDDHTAIAVSNQNHALEFFKKDSIAHILNMGFQSNFQISQMYTFPLSGESGSIDLVSLCG
jgi:hypothetical protein